MSLRHPVCLKPSHPNLSGRADTRGQGPSIFKVAFRTGLYVYICMYMYLYVYIYVYVYAHVYVYVYV